MADVFWRIGSLCHERKAHVDVLSIQILVWMNSQFITISFFVVLLSLPCPTVPLLYWDATKTLFRCALSQG